ncbi:MAG: fumarylacetoacetate hydrolase family protein [Rhodospirillales bacterium]
MRLARYTIGGTESWGVVMDGTIADVGARLRPRLPDLRAVLAANALAEVASAAADAPKLAAAAVRPLPPIGDPDKVICIGLNYRDHATETGRALPKEPSMFIKHASALADPGGTIVRPKASTHFDFEGELAVIIGRPARRVDPARAFDHVAGYACFNDGSIRDFQAHSVTAGKNFPQTSGFGPWLVTADEAGDPAKMTLATRLNGAEVQRSGVDALLYDIPTLIAYISSWTTLLPGDVIATGTPAGVGFRRTPPLFMKAGDTIEVEITGLGILRNTVADEA